MDTSTDPRTMHALGKGRCIYTRGYFNTCLQYLAQQHATYTASALPNN